MKQRRKDVPEIFKWRHFEPEIILLCVRWYLSYRLSYRNVVEMMNERGLSIAHTTILRWVFKFSFELEKRVRPHLSRRNKSWRMDETYIRVKGKWKYFFRAVDKNGQTIDFLLQHKKELVIPFTDLPTLRINSPSVGSTLITSAPWSPRSIVAVGPDTIAVKSTTFIPFNGPLFFIISSEMKFF